MTNSESIERMTISPRAAVTMLKENTFEDRDFVCALARTAYTNEDLEIEVSGE